MLNLVQCHLYIYITNNKGPDTEPCGTPLKTLQGVEVHPHTQHSVFVHSEKMRSSLVRHLLCHNDSTLTINDDGGLYQKPY